MLHHSQAEKKLPGKLFLHRQVDEGERRMARFARQGCLYIRCGGHIGKEIDRGQTYGFHDAFERAPGKALEEDLALFTHTNAQTWSAIRMGWATGSPPVHRSPHPLE